MAVTQHKSAPRLCRQGNTLQLTARGKPLVMLAGELHNSSASSLDYLCPLLDKLARCHLNTVLAPVSWELLEPVEGQFDFTLVDGMILAARRRGLRLVPLWFGTMKNATSCYAPSWVRNNLRRFPRAESTPGVSSWTVSPFSEEALRCDCLAFAALMKRIREVDAADQTVILVQVENESGILHSARDHSPAATAAFSGNVPAALLERLADKSRSVRPELRLAWEGCGARLRGTWQETFGRDAEEIFMGWHVARFVDAVAAAGRRAYDIPMYANAWLVGGPGLPPGTYPSGGPVSKLLDVWQLAAPHLDFIAPDIYLSSFRSACADYATQGNVLFIPEAKKDPAAAANALYALGRHQALGFSPFAIEDIEETHPLVETYRALEGMLPLVATARGTGRMTAFLQEADEESWTAELGGYRFRCRTSAKLADLRVPGSALLLLTEEGDFVCIGRNLIFTFESLNGALRTAEVLALDTGSFVNGKWQAGRRLNGDETGHGTGVILGQPLTVCRFRLFSYDKKGDAACGQAGHEIGTRSRGGEKAHPA